MSVLIAPRRQVQQHPSLVFVTQTRARVRALAPRPELPGDQIYGDEGQTLTAPPKVETAPDTGTTPAPEGANDRALSDQIAALDAARSLALNIDADLAERDERHAKIAQMRSVELDASREGECCELGAEIEAERAQIKILDERLEGADVALEVAAEAEAEDTAAPLLVPELSAYERTGVVAAANAARRLTFPFWRYHDARASEIRQSERDSIRCRDSNAAAIQRRNRFQREVRCTEEQVKFIEYLAGGEAASLIDHAPRDLKMREASLLIEWLKDGRPNIEEGNN